MVIAIASDHGGFALKEIVVTYLTEQKYEVLDLGTDSEELVDYPIYGRACAEAVASGKADKGIVICGTGIGICIAANKVHGIRCAVATSPFMAEMSRKHNDANILALGGRILEPAEALDIVDAFLGNEFEGGRHQRRIDLIETL